MPRPACHRCGAEGQIRHREPGTYYCPSMDCPVGEIAEISLEDYRELLSIVTQRTRELEVVRDENEQLKREMARLRQRNETLTKRIIDQAEEVEHLWAQNKRLTCKPR